MSGRRRVETSGPEETEAVGAELAAALRPGDVVLLEGELGAGKTVLVRGASRALGVRARVTSPTFTIGNRYAAPVPVSHLDLYRLAGLAAEEDELLADYVRPDAITFVEWPRDAELFLGDGVRIAARVRIAHAGGDRRTLEIEAPA